MLPKSLRINLSKEFKTIAASHRSESANLKFYFQKSDQPVARLGIALSKSYFKKAVLRNKARRKVSQTIESLYKDLPNGINLIIMPKTGVLDITIEDLKKEVRNVKNLFYSTN